MKYIPFSFFFLHISPKDFKISKKIIQKAVNRALEAGTVKILLDFSCDFGYVAL